MPTRRRSSVALVELQELVLPTQDVSVRVGWQGPNNLLDAAVLSFRFEEHLEDVYFYKPRAYDGAVMHVGGYQYSLRYPCQLLRLVLRSDCACEVYAFRSSGLSPVHTLELSLKTCTR